MIKVYSREKQEYIDETQYGEKILIFLYETVIGRAILKVLINPVTSKIAALYKKSFISKLDIKGLVKKYNIDMSLYEDKKYKSFNDFFTRTLKKENIKIDQNKEVFISPCDSKVIAYKITGDNLLNIKHSTYQLEELVKNKIDLSDYKNGYCLIFRLSLDNYHHYCYPDNGKLGDNYKIKGVLHTICSISEKYKIYKENKREVTVLKTENFDDIIFIEVGALVVGDIHNKTELNFTKGEEKGYFSMGGSTVVLLVKDNILKLDDDILENSEKGIETKVNYAERIGRKLN